MQSRQYVIICARVITQEGSVRDVGPISIGRTVGGHPSRGDLYMRNDLYTHFLQQPHNKLTWLVIFYFFFVLFSFLFVKK
jgi:hypothetical protein